MKYANFTYTSKNAINFGDQIQLLAIDYLYHCMGIPKNEIIYIDMHSAGTYEGPSVYLPVNIPLGGYHEHGVSEYFSKQIKPILLGISFENEHLSPEDIDFYKSNEPVGCRDEQTYNTMRKYGINAYLSGCITAILPKRNICNRQNQKVFLIDLPHGIEKYIPDNLLQNAVFDTNLTFEHIDNQREMTINRYKKIADEASMIITSRMHCAVPGIAMGIPTVFATEKVSFRLGWLEALMPIYTPTEFAQIDWNVCSVNYEEHKQNLIKLAEKRLKCLPCEDDIHLIHSFYMNRQRKPYVIEILEPIKKFLDTYWTDRNFPYQYSVWAMTTITEVIVDYIQECCPNAKLKHAYDIKFRGKFKGIPVVSPDNIKRYPGETVFVTSESAYDAAKKYFELIGYPKNSYVLLKF